MIFLRSWKIQIILTIILIEDSLFIETLICHITSYIKPYFIKHRCFCTTAINLKKFVARRQIHIAQQVTLFL